MPNKPCTPQTLAHGAKMSYASHSYLFAKRFEKLQVISACLQRTRLQAQVHLSLCHDTSDTVMKDDSHWADCQRADDLPAADLYVAWIWNMLLWSIVGMMQHLSTILKTCWQVLAPVAPLTQNNLRCLLLTKSFMLAGVCCSLFLHHPLPTFRALFTLCWPLPKHKSLESAPLRVVPLVLRYDTCHMRAGNPIQLYPAKNQPELLYQFCIIAL